MSQALSSHDSSRRYWYQVERALIVAKTLLTKGLLESPKVPPIGTSVIERPPEPAKANALLFQSDPFSETIAPEIVIEIPLFGSQVWKFPIICCAFPHPKPLMLH